MVRRRAGKTICGTVDKRRAFGMTDKSIWLIFNLDLEEDLFVAIANRIGELSGLGGTVVTLEELSDAIAGKDEQSLGLMITFGRRLDPGPSSVSPGLAGLGRLERSLETRQMKRAFGRVVFVDCSEMPNAPLSDFGVIGQYLEAVSDACPAVPFAGVYALDAERGPSDGWTDGLFRWWDTRSDAFVDHMRDHLVETLQMFNPSGDSD